MNPTFDWHALAPDIVLTATILVVLVADLLCPRARTLADVAHRGDRRARRADPGAHARRRRHRPRRCSAARTSSTTTRSRSRASSSSSRTSSLLLSVDYIDEGDYYQGEFYFLLLTSVLGHDRDGVGARPHHASSSRSRRSRSRRSCSPAGASTTAKSNEAAIKYYLIGVLSSAMMLYGMSLIFGVDRRDAALATSPTASSTARHDAAARGRHLPDPRRVRVQGQRGAVPLLGARHLRGRAHAGHRVPLGGVEGRRVRRPAQHHLLRLLGTVAATRGGRCSGPRRARR